MLARIATIAVLACCAGLIQATIYLKETFPNAAALDAWIPSKSSGNWRISAGQFHADATANLGLQTTKDLTKFAISRTLEPVFDSTIEGGHDLVVQFSVKHDQQLDCGGGYIKLLAPGVNLEEFNGETPYLVMFGPDICGKMRKTHLIIADVAGKQHMTNATIYPGTDQLTHLYTLVLHKDKTYSVMVDGEEISKGSLAEIIPDLYPTKTILDPSAHKPTDWIDDQFMPDPEDKKPAGWVDSDFIPDPDAAKPAEWNEEEDGEWEPPLMSNPDYKGEWQAKQILNPAYKGEWKAPEIKNPDWTENVEQRTAQYTIGAVGFEIWQVRHGTIFDNIIVTDDVEEARQLAEETYTALKAAEKAAYEKFHTEEIEALQREEEANEALQLDNSDDEEFERKKAQLDEELGLDSESDEPDADNSDLTHDQLVDLGLAEPDNDFNVPPLENKAEHDEL